MTWSRRLVLVGAGLVLGSFYLFRMAPTITIGDSAELAAVGGTLGIGHSPGYPLYSILSSLGSRLLPFAGTAYRTNVQSTFWVAACVGMIGLIQLEMTGSLSVALLAGLLLGLSPLWANQALLTEVFGLNSFFAALVLYVMLLPVTIPRVYLATFLLGLGLGNNHTLILLVPALLFAGWPVIRERPLSVLVGMLGFGALGLSIYLFIPLRAHCAPVMNWENPVTGERFWKLFTRARYGSFQLAQGRVAPIGMEDVVEQMTYLLQVLWQNVGPFSLAILLPFGAGFKSRKRQVLLCFVAFLFCGPLFFIWTHLHVTPHTRAILDRFMYLPLVPAGVLLGMGLSVAAQMLNRLRVPARFALLGMGLGVLCWAGTRTVPFERNSFYVWDLGRDLLRNTPPGTLLFADRADEAEFSLAYLQRRENRRPDVKFIDCNAGVSTSIYGPDYYDVWGRPRLATRTLEERKLIAAWSGPVFYATHEPEMIPIERVQEGLLFAVPQKGSRRVLPWDQILIFRKPVASARRPVSRDRGLYGDYLGLLAQDAFKSNRTEQGMSLYHGSDLYARS